MKQYRFNKNNMSIIIQSSLMASVMLISGCSNNKEKMTTSYPSDPISTVETSYQVTETTSNVTPTPVVYDFQWSEMDSEEFNNYFQSRFNGKVLKGYVYSYGFTSELNDAFTDFVNIKFNKNYDYVPLDTANYFKSYLTFQGSSRVYVDSYDDFCSNFLKEDFVKKGSFNNRLIMSYLIQNNIPFGERVPVENMKCILGKDTFTFSSTDHFKAYNDIGNYDTSYAYSDKDLFTVLACYNSSITSLCGDIRNYDFDIFTTNPEYSEDSIELCQTLNSYLIEYFGDNAPQLGEVPNLENYKAMFPGEELVDVSRISGGIFDPSEPRIAEAVPEVGDIDISAPTIDENILGEWTGYNEAAGFTYIYTFYDDNTGTYESIHSVSDIQSGSSSQQNDVVDFTYSIQYGTLVVNYSSGNSIQYKYKINDQGMLVIGGMEYEYTSPVRSR